MNRYLFFGLLALLLSTSPIPAAQAQGICGNGRVDPGEACDDGPRNSDIAPNACRTDCRRAYCGDSVIDRGEQCDDGYGGDRSTVCRSNCTLPRCGDGIRDFGTRTMPPLVTYNEQCDDGNKDNDDGCNTACQKCEMLDRTGNLAITADTELCSNVFQLDDDGDYGALIIKRNGVTLDCNGAELNGAGRGYGIYVYRARNITIKNCKVRGYEVGIRLEDGANATLSNNQVCGNSRGDIELVDTPVGLGRNNACVNSGGWNDQGRTGCTQRMASCNFDNRSSSRTKPASPSPVQQEADKPTGDTKDDVPAFLRRLLIKP